MKRIVLHPDKIEVEVSTGELRAALSGSPSTASPPGNVDVLRLALEVWIKRHGSAMRLVVPPNLPASRREKDKGLVDLSRRFRVSLWGNPDL